MTSSLNRPSVESLSELVNLSRLQSIDIKIGPNDSSGPGSAAKRWLKWLLHSFTSYTGDVEIEECTLHLVGLSVQDDLQTLADSWHALDEVIASWPCLRKLTVDHYWCRPSVSEPQIWELGALDVDALFPLMSAKGKLIIAFEQQNIHTDYAFEFASDHY